MAEHPFRDAAYRNRAATRLDPIDAQWLIRAWAAAFSTLAHRPRLEIVDVSGPLFERESRR